MKPFNEYDDPDYKDCYWPNEFVMLNRKRELSKEQMLTILKIIREHIASEGKLEAEDSNMIGNKYTICSWGLCSENPEFFPDALMHTWPREYDNHKRVAPLGLPEGTWCPMRAVKEHGLHEHKGGASGCFYQCRVFQRKLKTPTREEALALYDEEIAALEAELNGTNNGNVCYVHKNLHCDCIVVFRNQLHC